jgi:GNAT superfamily N-acetyltransferase
MVHSFFQKCGVIKERFVFFQKKYSRNYTDYGLWVSSKKAIAYLFRPFYQKSTFYLYQVDLDKYNGLIRETSKYVFRMIDPSETVLIDQIEGMEEWLKGTMKKRLESNCLCMVVLDEERVVGFIYASTGEGNIPLLRLRVLLGPGEAWGEQITISRDYRRQGLGSRLRSSFYRELKVRGIQRSYGHVQAFNVAGKQSAKKFTLKVMVRAEYKRVLWVHSLKCTEPLPNTRHGVKRFHAKSPARPTKSETPNALLNAGTPVFIVRIEDIK